MRTERSILSIAVVAVSTVEIHDVTDPVDAPAPGMMHGDTAAVAHASRAVKAESELELTRTNDGPRFTPANRSAAPPTSLVTHKWGA